MAAGSGFGSVFSTFSGLGSAFLETTRPVSQSAKRTGARTSAFSAIISVRISFTPDRMSSVVLSCFSGLIIPVRISPRFATAGSRFQIARASSSNPFSRASLAGERFLGLWGRNRSSRRLFVSAARMPARSSSVSFPCDSMVLRMVFLRSESCRMSATRSLIMRRRSSSSPPDFSFRYRAMNDGLLPSSSNCTAVSTWVLRSCRSWAIRERSSMGESVALGMVGSLRGPGQSCGGAAHQIGNQTEKFMIRPQRRRAKGRPEGFSDEANRARFANRAILNFEFFRRPGRIGSSLS